ncbi:PIG-L deacetylase family protein [Crossiella cryophila]|uniref:LmbE family N-acetylglucosaminyl deacetylase n=1 Tax=Crossiella cryophila TaxID=43355 RepID=A0A7W7FS04_9PSEU|nr:PIG-L family deacetylase [Crossiella cryophila]MBB4676566.1 LmbE family N-acetylglucosaminyl deacetylase [Crossiella cryophila]
MDDHAGLSRRRLLGVSAAALGGLALGQAPAAAADWPAIFYAPHQDDESIAMAGAIRAHKEAGRPVYLVLLSRGENGGLIDIINGNCNLGADCPSGDPGHRIELSLDDIVAARTAEFTAAAHRLGVDRVINMQHPDSAWTDYPGFVQYVRETILDFESRHPGASHKLVSGWRDVIHGGDPADPNKTHAACRDAAESLRERISDFRYYWVYGYTYPPAERTADHVVPLTPAQHARKRQALAEYRHWDPANGRYALGYHSVRLMIDPAAADPHEYLDVPR